MSEDKEPISDQNPTPETLESGTYEILRNRMLSHNEELIKRLNKLNTSRKEVFGSIDTALVATERISTEHNCVPWDMVPFGNKFLFGYNVHMGLKTETELNDVFSVYEYTDHNFVPQSLDFIHSDRFEDDFKNLYRYYKATQFVKFAILGPYLFMVFRVGKSVGDIKTLKWLIEGNTIKYEDARSEHDFKYPNQHEFSWSRTNRDMHRKGKHPHISIEDIVFVEATEGDLTLKVEDNTASGQGIYSEPVENPDQTLDDAEIAYSVVGNVVLLKVRPYQENNTRYIVYNSKIQEALRIDAIEDACVLLPDDHGLIFPKGYYLQTGEFKLFDTEYEDMVFEKKITSPNGEDFLYVFFNRERGTYLLLSYNLISQTVLSPITCSGYSLFENGEMCYFKSDDEPKKHHVVQIWQTPFVGPNFELATENKSYLYKVGNKDIVRGMSECNEIAGLLRKDDSYANLYLDILKTSSSILDTYYWITEPECENLAEPLTAIRDSASNAIDEFEKVKRIKQNTSLEISRVRELTAELDSEIKKQAPEAIGDYVNYLAQLRSLRGEIISLRDMRYADLAVIEELETLAEEKTSQISEGCVKFLVKPTALAPYEDRVSEIANSLEAISKVVEANDVEDNIKQTSGELEMLIDIVSNLKIEDTTLTTQIIDNISKIYSDFNQINANLSKKRKELLGVEGKAEFNAQIKLINQGIVNYLDLVTTPEQCDEYVAKLMLQVEELDAKFSDFEEFTEKLSIKREEIYNAFESRKVGLLEKRNKRANALQQSAERIIGAAQNRLSKFSTAQEINGYFASDLMMDKARNIIEELLELGDTVKADDVQSKLKTAKEDALRQLKDKSELYGDDENTIVFGPHKFLVNNQELNLSLINKDKQLQFHLAGTNFFEVVDSDSVNKCQPVWDQALVSENNEVYRSEYLAYVIFTEALSPIKDEPLSKSIAQLHELTLAELQEHIVKYSALRYNEGYIKGVHDHDAAQILANLVEIHINADLLRYPSTVRAAGRFFWCEGIEGTIKESYAAQLGAAGMLMEVFPDTGAFVNLKTELSQHIQSWQQETKLFKSISAEAVADYLFRELASNETFIQDQDAKHLLADFNEFLKTQRNKTAYNDALKDLENQPAAQYRQSVLWLESFVSSTNHSHTHCLPEAAVQLVVGQQSKVRTAKVALELTLDKMMGSHRVIQDGAYHLHLNDFLEKMESYTSGVKPLYEEFQVVKKDLIEEFTNDLRLSEFKPRVMNSFVRNQLIDKVYLPLIGNNLAKQIGTAGENKRTDLMGLLLLISPPGYGKTTLMEYIANRLGIIFVKINGPSIGHEITAVDPAQATNSGAREELEKLNLAFEMGDNVMIYLDDIQHCNPEFLQKFISLCDAQRKIEGVYKGRGKTYDFRGKKVCVVMAGNPYTESGDKFRIPDMLSNRADIYNLGDIIGDSAEPFKLSYIQNCLTSNTVLNKLAAKSHNDVLEVFELTKSDGKGTANFEANHGPEEINEYVSVMKKLITVRDIVLRVNQEYIYSAGQEEMFRTEPAFKLQGSYRDMNKMAEKIVSVMNEDELDTMIMSHYENEAQTLTTGAEANILKFKELRGILTEEELERWEVIKKEFAKNNKLKSLGNDNQFAAVLSQMESISEGLIGIQSVMSKTSKSKPTIPTVAAPEKEKIEPKQDVALLMKDVLQTISDNQTQIISELVKQKHFDEGVVDKEQAKLAAKQQKKEEQQALVDKAKAEAEAKVKKMRSELSVAVVEKGFTEDGDQSYLTYKFAFENKTSKKISAFSGSLAFFDQVEEQVHQIDISFDEGIEPEATITWNAQMLFNQFLDSDITLKDLTLEELTTAWNPRSVKFARASKKK